MSEVYFIHAVVVIGCHYTHTIGFEHRDILHEDGTRGNSRNVGQ